MLIYLVLLLIITIAYLFKAKNLAFLVTILILISSLRDLTVGVDLFNYYEIYSYDMYSYYFDDLIKKHEIGWIIINLGIKESVNSFRYIILLASFLTIVPVAITYRKMSPIPVLSLLLYFLLFYYFYSYSIIRQAISSSFFLLSLYYYKKDKFWSLIYIGIAVIFHYSSLALIPIVIFLNYLKFNSKWKIYLIVATYLIGFTGLLESVTSYFVYLPFDKYANYIDYKQGEAFNRISSYLFLIPRNILGIYLITLYKKHKVDNNLLLNIFWIGIIFNNLFLAVPLVSRFVISLLLVETILIPTALSYLSDKKFKFASLLFLLYGSIYFIYYLLSNRYSILPYDYVI